MIASTQKPTLETRDPVGRPATGETPIRQIRIPDDEWDDLRKVAGRGHVRVLRDFIRWYLRRSGAKLPARPSGDEIAAALKADAKAGD
jgi:hypothetical protein